MLEVLDPASFMTDCMVLQKAMRTFPDIFSMAIEKTMSLAAVSYLVVRKKD